MRIAVVPKSPITLEIRHSYRSWSRSAQLRGCPFRGQMEIPRVGETVQVLRFPPCQKSPSATTPQTVFGPASLLDFWDSHVKLKACPGNTGAIHTRTPEAVPILSLPRLDVQIFSQHFSEILPCFHTMLQSLTKFCQRLVHAMSTTFSMSVLVAVQADLQSERSDSFARRRIC